MYARPLPEGGFDVGFEDFDMDAELDARAHEIATRAQESIREAYRSPFTFNAAVEAARLALNEAQVTIDALNNRPVRQDLDPHLARRELDETGYLGV